MTTTGDQQLVKRINRSVLLRLLWAQPSLSRARLAEKSGLTKSTVSALVRELLDERWIDEDNANVATAGVGRPSTPLHINGDLRVLIGLEVAVECLRMVCVSLTGQIISQTEQALQSHQPHLVCAQATGLVQGLCQALASRRLLLSGLGVCLPGAVDDESGVVRFAPNLTWRNVDFLAMLTQSLSTSDAPPVSIYLQNDADAAALSEYEFGADDKSDPLIFISCDVGVGAGVVLNDGLFTGALGVAGEIGHTILQIDGPLCSCGRSGCAETVIGSRALTSPEAIGRAGEFLGVLMQNLDATVNPRTLVLGGKTCVTHPELRDSAMQTLRRYAQAAGMPLPVLRAARYGLLAPAVGAAALVLHELLRPTRKRLPSALANPDCTAQRAQVSTQDHPAYSGARHVSWH